MKKREKNSVKAVFFKAGSFIDSLLQGKPLLVLFLFFILLIIMCLAFAFGMYLVDRIMPWFGGYFEHNRTGDAWFSVLGCFVSAVPSIILSLVAILQTQRINSIDRKIRRPMLAFQGAKLTAWYLNQTDYERSSLYQGMTVQEQNAVRKYQEKQADREDYCLLKIDIDMLQKNEIGFDHIEIINCYFGINGKTYKFTLDKEKNSPKLKSIKQIKHSFKDGVELYNLQWVLIAFTPSQTKLWSELYLAIKNEEFLNNCYEEFVLEVEMQIQFGMDQERNEILRARICFCSEEGYSSDEDAIYCVSTKNGQMGYY